MTTTLPSESAWAAKDLASPELGALFACARAVVDPRDLTDFQAALSACPSAERLCDAAVAHGMLGHLHRLATAREAEIDPALLHHLGEVQAGLARRNLRQTGRLLLLLDQLRAVGVEAMPYKGPVWAESLYGDIALRTWSDLDLLVRHEQVPLVREVLLSFGFKDGNRFNTKLLSRKRRGWGEIGLSLAEVQLHLDVHWEISVGVGARSLDSEQVFLRAAHRTLLGREVLTPSLVDRLLIICAGGTRDRWGSIEKLLGLALQVRDTPPEIWQRVIAAAHGAGCERRVAIAVAHVSRVFDLPVPPAVVAVMADDSVARWLLPTLRPESLEEGPSWRDRPTLDHLFWKFATEDSALAGLGHASVRFFRAGPEDWEWVTLPRYAEWLYPVLRPARLALKWARRSSGAADVSE